MLQYGLRWWKERLLSAYPFLGAFKISIALCSSAAYILTAAHTHNFLLSCPGGIHSSSVCFATPVFRVREWKNKKENRTKIANKRITRKEEEEELSSVEMRFTWLSLIKLRGKRMIEENGVFGRRREDFTRYGSRSEILKTRTWRRCRDDHRKSKHGWNPPLPPLKLLSVLVNSVRSTDESLWLGVCVECLPLFNGLKLARFFRLS